MLSNFHSKLLKFDYLFLDLEKLNELINKKSKRLYLLTQIGKNKEDIQYYEWKIKDKYTTLNAQKNKLDEYRNYLNFFFPTTQEKRIKAIDELRDLFKNEKVLVIENKNYEIQSLLREYDDKAQEEFIMRGSIFFEEIHKSLINSLHDEIEAKKQAFKKVNELKKIFSL